MEHSESIGSDKQDNPMMVSVIIPYFNKGGTIDRAVNSVINQNYSNWELIIVDDCSLEPLLKKSAWESYRISVYRNEKNLGPGPSRQYGMDQSKGKYLAFLDADDWWDEDFLSESIRVHQDKPLIAATWAQSETLWKDGSKTIRKYSSIPFTSIQSTILRYPRPWQTGSLVWKREFCGEWGNLSTNQDYYFELSSSLKCDQVYPLSKVLYFVDQSLGNHRTDLVTKLRSVQNSFDLFAFAHSVLHKRLTTRYKILLYHRIIRCLLKIVELKEDKVSELYWTKAERLYPTTKFFIRKPLALKIMHKGLQRTPFKLHF